MPFKMAKSIILRHIGQGKHTTDEFAGRNMMRSLSLITMAAGIVFTFGLPAYAQQQAAPPPPPPAYGAPVTTDQAKKAVEAAIVEAKKLPYLYAFAVVDPSGSLIYFEKMDGAPYASTEIAIRKARTAATYKRPTKAFFDAFEGGHPYVATLEPGLVAALGGVPLIVGGKVVGAIGVSGGPTGVFDNGAAEAAAGALK
jgi:glc operon protein GlcG